MITHRAFMQSDYPLYEQWLTQRNRESPKLDELSDKGYVVSLDGKDCAIGFIISGGKSAVLGHLSSNPSLDSAIRSEAVDYLLDTLISEAKKMGFRNALMATNLTKLVDRLCNKNFTIEEQNITHLMRIL